MSKKLLIGVFAAALLATSVFAHEYNVGSLHIGHPWSRATPKGAPVGGGYLSITNNGTTPDTLVSGTSPVSKTFELHEMKTENGVMKMRPLTGGVEIKPGQTVTLSPGGEHIMFVGLKQPLKQGERIPATLNFAKAGQVKVEFVVEGMGATHGGEAKHDMPGMPGMPGMAGHQGH
jgi:copper(I)-binding protein